MNTKELSKQIDETLSSSLGDDFIINTSDDMLIVLAMSRMEISVDMDTETITVTVYGYSVWDSLYNEQMVAANGGAQAVAMEIAKANKPDSFVTRFSVEYIGDNAENLGNALVAIRDWWNMFPSRKEC